MKKDYWMDTKEISELAECCMQNAREIKNELHEMIKKKGLMIPNKRKVPKEMVYKYLGIKEPQEESK